MEVELLAPDVSLVSGLEGVGGLRLQEETGTLWECRKLVGWEQFWKHIPIFMRKKKTFLPLGAFCVHSPWKIRPFAFLWSFWWHSSPTREAAEGFSKRASLSAQFHSASKATQTLTMEQMLPYLTVVNSIY